MNFKFVYKICTKSEWHEIKIKGQLTGSKKDLEDGYIHFSGDDQVGGTLKKGGRVSLVGFGSWSVSKRAARDGRNPQTGATIKIAAKNVVKFKAGAELSGSVN